METSETTKCSGRDLVPTRLVLVLLALLVPLAPLAPSLAAADPPAGPAPAADPAAELVDLSLEELMDLEVTSVSKRSETIAEAAAAVYVLTGDDIRRSGVTSIPEALRLVPGLAVARATSNVWAISARGFNGRFANKLLVLVDGRSVYTPLFSGVFWDVQDTLLEDVDRIEVIRGPGAALWGANAVNGVINILTKDAAATRGGLATATVGSEIDGIVAVRWGGASGLDGRTAWRAFAKVADRDAGAAVGLDGRIGGSGDDAWSVGRGGFRVDHEGALGGRWTLQGDLYDGEAGERQTLPQLAGPPRVRAASIDLAGGNLLGRWSRGLENGSALTLQVYGDRTELAQPLVEERRTTWDAELQHAFARGRHDVVWGLGLRRTEDELAGSDFLSFAPAARTDDLASLFVQDEIALAPDRLWLTLGARLEHNDYTGFELQPTVRALWIPRRRHTVWAAVSRAVRTPSRADADIALTSGVLPPGALFPGSPPALTRFVGSDDYRSEELIAYELGYRVGLGRGLFLDLALFYDSYDDLRSSTPGEPSLALVPPPPHLEIPVVIDNGLAGETYGFELAAEWWASDRWRLAAGYSLLESEVDAGGAIDGTSPRHQLQLRSSWDLGERFRADVVGRWIDRLPAIGVDAYAAADLRLAWTPRPSLTLAVVGRNLTEESHVEFVPEIIPVAPTAVERSVHTTLTWRF